MNFKLYINYSTAKKQTGLVLMAVIVFLLITSLLVANAALLLDRNLETAALAKQNVIDSAQIASKANELAYLMATHRQTPAGISRGTNIEGLRRNEDGQFIHRIIGDELRTDGFKYRVDDLIFSIQNQKGSIPININNSYWLKAWLSSEGLSTFEQNKLIDELGDYADPDNVQRPAGDEKGTIVAPSNYLLQSCQELYLISSWRSYLNGGNKTSIAFLPNCSLARSSVINFNSISLLLWQKMWPNSLARVRTMRERGIWFSDVAEVKSIEPSIQTIPEEYISVIGNNGYHFIIQTNSSSKTYYIKLGTGRSKPFKWL